MLKKYPDKLLLFVPSKIFRIGTIIFITSSDREFQLNGNPNFDAFEGDSVAWLGRFDSQTRSISQSIVLPQRKSGEILVLTYAYQIGSAETRCGDDLVIQADQLPLLDVCDSTVVRGQFDYVNDTWDLFTIVPENDQKIRLNRYDIPIFSDFDLYLADQNGRIINYSAQPGHRPESLSSAEIRDRTYYPGVSVRYHIPSFPTPSYCLEMRAIESAVLINVTSCQVYIPYLANGDIISITPEFFTCQDQEVEPNNKRDESRSNRLVICDALSIIGRFGPDEIDVRDNNKFFDSYYMQLDSETNMAIMLDNIPARSRYDLLLWNIPEGIAQDGSVIARSENGSNQVERIDIVISASEYFITVKNLGAIQSSQPYELQLTFE